MQLAFLAPASRLDATPSHETHGFWWRDAPKPRPLDEPRLDEVVDPDLVAPELRRAAVAWYARVRPTPVHRP